MPAQTEPNPLGKLILGALIGVGITYAYVRFGYKPPAVVQLAEKVTDGAVATTASLSLYSPTASDDERQRALLVYLSKEPEVLLEVNRELDGRIMQEVLRRKALGQAKVLKHQMTAYEGALARPALREVLQQKYGVTDDDQLKRRMLATAIRKDEFLHWYLKRISLNQSDDHLVDVVLGSYQNELRTGRIALAPRERN